MVDDVVDWGRRSEADLSLAKKNLFQGRLEQI